MSTSAPYSSRLPPPPPPQSDNRDGAHLPQFQMPEPRSTNNMSRATGYTNGRGIEAAFERSYEESRNKRPRTDYNGAGMMSSAHDEAMMSPPRLPSMFSYSKSSAYPPSAHSQNFDGPYNVSSSSTPAMPTLPRPEMRPTSADGVASLPRATTAHPFDRPPPSGPNSGQPISQHRYTQSQHHNPPQTWRDGLFNPHGQYPAQPRPHSVHDRSHSQSHHPQNDYNQYANDNIQRRDRGMTVDGARMIPAPSDSLAQRKSMSISSLLDRPTDPSTKSGNERRDYWQPPRNDLLDSEDVPRTQHKGEKDGNRADQAWNGGARRTSRGFTIGTAPVDFAQSLDRIKQESLSPELRRSAAKLYKPAESEESSLSAYGRRSSFDSALPNLNSRPPIFPTPPNDHDMIPLGGRAQRPISESQSAPRSPLGLSHRRLKTASGYELPPFVQPPAANDITSYSGYPHPPLLPEGFHQTSANGIISFSGYPHPPLLPDARFPIPSIEDRQLPSLAAATGFVRNQKDDDSIAVYGPHLQNVAYGPELPPGGPYRRQEHDTLPPLHTFDHRSGFHPPMAYADHRHERSALTPSEPGDSPLLRRAALHRAQGGLTPTRQRSLQGFDNSRRSSLAKVLAYNPAARSSITPSREGTPQHPRITNLNLRDEHRRGRMSPTPQAMQGAAQQSRGPTTDPGIRQEFGKMFSGIGSGLGSASSTPAPEDVPALRLSPIMSRNRPTPLRNGTNSEDRFRSASRNALKRPREGTDGSGEHSSELIGSYGLIRSLSERSAKKGRLGPEPIRRPSIPLQNQSESGQNRRSAYPALLTPGHAEANGNGLASPSNGHAVPTVGPPPRRPETTVPTGNGPSVHHHHHHHHHPANPHHHHHHHHHANRAASGISPAPVQKHPQKRVVDSTAVLSQASVKPRTHLGFMTYSSELVPAADEFMSPFRKTYPCEHRPIPLFTPDQVNSTFTIRVPSLYLSSNPFLTVLEDHAVWGTDVYTDDSDPIAAAVHAGFILNPYTSEPTSLEFVNAGDLSQPETPQFKAGHEAHITVVILPTLELYASSTNYGIRSREWRGTRHDGMSFKVLSIEWLAKYRPRNRKN